MAVAFQQIGHKRRRFAASHIASPPYAKRLDLRNHLANVSAIENIAGHAGDTPCRIDQDYRSRPALKVFVPSPARGQPSRFELRIDGRGAIEVPQTARVAIHSEEAFDRLPNPGGPVFAKYRKTILPEIAHCPEDHRPGSGEGPLPGERIIDVGDASRLGLAY